MEENTIMITMPLAKYDALIKTANQYSILLETLKAASDLNYRREGLTFDDQILDRLLMLFEPEGYRQRLQELQKREEQ